MESFYNSPIDYSMSFAWSWVKGTPNRVAAEKCKDSLLPIIEKNNVDFTDPRKAHRDKMYEDCV